ncbi:MAG: PQQ-dependent sugar dehydrogenase, partial [Pseudomonadota bacterium]
MNIFTSIFLTALVAVGGQAAAQSNRVVTQEYNLDVELFAEGFDNPWAMAFLPDGDLLVTERAGRLYRVSQGRLTEIHGLPEVWDSGQGGLLDIELHPQYGSGQDWIYLTFSSPRARGEGGRGGNTALMRARLDNDQLVDSQLLFKAQPNYRPSKHFGSRVVFDRDGYLYVTIGDRGDRDQVQRYDNYRGKIIRLHDDGRVPDDNPFVDDPQRHNEIWSGGHRNPQGLALHPATGALWSHEHGPRGGDELNLVTKGANYGWPLITYGINYIGTEITDKTSAPGLLQPVLHWTPSIAPSGMTFVDSDKYPAWEGNILVGSLKFRQLQRLVIKGETVTHQETLLQGIGR